VSAYNPLWAPSLFSLKLIAPIHLPHRLDKLLRTLRPRLRRLIPRHHARIAHEQRRERGDVRFLLVELNSALATTALKPLVMQLPLVKLLYSSVRPGFLSKKSMPRKYGRWFEFMSNARESSDNVFVWVVRLGQG
jgi:hypothetical protein